MKAHYEAAILALQQVANEKGITLDEVTREIELVIKLAIENCCTMNNCVGLAEWSKIPCVGEIPTPVELIAYLAAKQRGE